MFCMSRFQKPTPRKTLSFRVRENVHKFLAGELRVGNKNKSRFLEALLNLGIESYRKSGKEIINL